MTLDEIMEKEMQCDNCWNSDYCRSCVKKIATEYARSIIPEEKVVTGDFRECCNITEASTSNLIRLKILSRIEEDLKII